MTADLMPFTYEGQQVRVVQIDGEPWFVLADLTRVLGLSQFRTDRLDDALIQSHPITDSLGRTQQATIVAEPGMYEVVIRSDKPEAVAFRRWITGTVLPTIRRTGSYSTTPELTGPELLARAVLEAQTMLAAKDERIAELEPKADLADTYLAADGGDRLIGQVAKLLHLKEKDLRRFLLEEHLIFVRHTKCGTPQYEPYAEFAPHFSVHETIVNHTWGACSHLTLRAKPRGLDLIRRRLTKAGLIAIDGQRVTA